MRYLVDTLVDVTITKVEMTTILCVFLFTSEMLMKMTKDEKKKISHSSHFYEIIILFVFQ